MITHNNFLLIEVPEDARGIHVVNSQNNMGQAIFFSKEINFKLLWPEFKILPPGQWEIIGKASEVGEEVLASVVSFDYSEEIEGQSLPSESFISLLKSHGMKPENCLILKLKTNE